ncbi:hypothetical protein IV81_GL000388 [Pediococcus stilesii]|uniref:Uncharacterized protein n=2 Tax=Pediococcus stilesii TaxID=331679 RepID=A0A0R2KVP1_9LACO|nr:hypothetical protein IV81_GL000388 [Pediococcus stilesii]
MEIFNTMSEKGWNIAANGAGVLSLVAVFLFVFRLVTGRIDFWTILFFSLIVTGAVAYALIHMILKIRKLTPHEESVVNQVSDTKEFVGLFFSILVMMTTAVGLEFFSGSSVGKTAGTLLFIYTIVAIVVKVYDIQRITSAKRKGIKLVQQHDFRHLSRAEQLGLGMVVLGLILMMFWPNLSFLSYIGLMIFLIRPLVHRVEGRLIDLLLMWINLIMVGISAILTILK